MTMPSSENHSHEASILHSSDNGFLVYCPGCDRFKLAFGTFWLSQDITEIRSLAALINRYNHHYFRRAKRTRRDIFVDGPHPDFGLLMSPRDLEQLNHILQTGLLVLEAGGRVRLQ
ncbi:DUF6686 family protein [Neolewinella antarctica]|uniref:Uncharacterized protein n=1 Tax=Neolewinella antarctica TaxID=442734 RepID=A0ABX0XC35_9BACT|nr:DUF6686 family protein [Neolewinella antarctica]NJC26767.1 hypothetical protein [Neolewinella antarctica]